MVTHTRLGNPVGEGGGDVCSLGGDKKISQLGRRTQFSSPNAGNAGIGGGKVLKWGSYPGGGASGLFLCLVTHFSVGEWEGD
jgi:hypothetical protein